MNYRSLTLACLLAILAGVLAWNFQSQPLPAQVLVPVPEPTAQLPQTPASATVAAAPVEEVDAADTETTLDKLLPRRSAGHAAGLHKVEDAVGLGSSAALVVDANTREVLLAKNAQAVLPIASITKLMTGLVIAEAGLPMDTLLTITDDDVDEERHSSSRLRVGTLLTRDEALHLALMSSENRAAHALARTAPGGLAAFVAAMNAKARALNMADTRYVDPTGLSSANQSSARDLATLALAASKVPVLREYSTSRQHLTQLGHRTLQYNNSNRLVKNGQWDILLQKTGYIVEAGHCMVVRTRIAGRDLALVLLDAADNGARSADAERIRRWLDPNAPAPVAERAAKPSKRVKRTFTPNRRAD